MPTNTIQVTKDEEAALLSLYRTLREYVHNGERLETQQMEPSDFMLIHRDVDLARHCLREIFTRIGRL